MRPQSAVAWQLLDEVLTTGAAREVTIGSALDLLGTRQVVELVATAGYYTTLAYVMNVAGTQPPEGAPMPRTESAR